MKSLWLVLGLLVPLLYSAQHSTNAPAFAAAAADAKRLQLAPGLKLDVWAAEPQLSNSVAFSIDNKGRVFLAESDRWAVSVFDITAHTNWLVQDMSHHTVADRAAFLSNQFATNLTFLTKDSEAVRLVEDRDGDGHADHSEIVATGFNSVTDGTAAGVLATGTNLYFANIPNLWRISNDELRMTNGNPIESSPRNSHLATRTSLASGFGVHIGVSGHDLHGLIKGPDGRIYMSFGDRGVCLTNREGVVINLPDCGGVLRCELDGRDLELFCYGLRNPQELAFDDLGNLWTVDNDTAGVDPCRVLHLVEGGDYGWRTSYQHMEGFGPWVQEELWRGGQDGILPPAGTVSQGPAGLAYYPGTGFGDRLAGTFLHCDFPAGVTAFTVKPRGASYMVDHQEKFLWNCWPTDVDFGPDGAAYVLDWVSGWGQPGKGRIYRITPAEFPSPFLLASGFSPVNAVIPVASAVSTASTSGAKTVETAAERPASGTGLKPGVNETWRKEAALVTQVKRLLSEGMAQRGERELLDLLGHADRRVRLEAQWELAERGTNSFNGLLDIVKNSRSRLARIHGLWAVGQVAREVDAPAVTRTLKSLLDVCSDNDHIVREQALLTLSDARLIHVATACLDALGDKLPSVQAAGFLSLAHLSSRGAHRYIESRADKIVGAVAETLQSKFDDYDVSIATVRSVLRFEGFYTLKEGQFGEKLSAFDLGDPFVVHFASLALQRIGMFFPTVKSYYDDSDLWMAGSASSPTVRLLALQARRRLASLEVTKDDGFRESLNRDQATTALTNFLADPDPRLVIAAGRAIHDVPIVEGFPLLAAFITRIDCPTNLMSRVIDACFRLGTPQHAQMLAGFAKRRDVPDWARALALRDLGDWGKPPPLDRVNGLWRPAYGGVSSGQFSVSSNAPASPSVPAENSKLKTENSLNPLLAHAAQAASPRTQLSELPALPSDLGRSASFEEGMAVKRNDAPAKRAFLRVAGEIMDPATPDEIGIVVGGSPAPAPVQLAVIDAAVRLRTKEASSPLFSEFTRSNTPPEVRRAIVPALAALNAAQAGDAVKLALADPDPALRAAALPHLDHLDGGDAVPVLAGLVDGSTPDLRLAQAAFAALAKIPGAEAEAMLGGAMQRLLDHKLPPELELDVVSAATPREALRELVQRREARLLLASDDLTPFHDRLLGGDAERGRQIFFSNQTVQCSRCHAVGGNGGTVGPKLDGVGKRQPRTYLLESIVHPSAKLAAGFETVVLTLRDGQTVAGALKGEADGMLAIEAPDEAGSPVVTQVAKSDVTQRERGPSAMPEGLSAQLTPFELRDLLEYLASLN